MYSAQPDIKRLYKSYIAQRFKLPQFNCYHWDVRVFCFGWQRFGNKSFRNHKYNPLCLTGYQKKNFSITNSWNGTIKIFKMLWSALYSVLWQHSDSVTKSFLLLCVSVFQVLSPKCRRIECGVFFLSKFLLKIKL